MVAKFGRMGQKTKTKSKPVELLESHPYKQYEDLPEWKILWNSIDDLVKNADLTETTNRSYIVGYLVKQLRCKRG